MHVRAELVQNGLDSFLLATDDEHLSERPYWTPVQIAPPSSFVANRTSREVLIRDTLQSVPMRAHHAGRRSNLCRDDFELLFGYAKDVHLNMDSFVNTEFSDDSPGRNIEVLKTLDDASDSARISVGDDPKSE